MNIGNCCATTRDIDVNNGKIKKTTLDKTTNAISASFSFIFFFFWIFIFDLCTPNVGQGPFIFLVFYSFERDATNALHDYNRATTIKTTLFRNGMEKKFAKKLERVEPFSKCNYFYRFLLLFFIAQQGLTADRMASHTVRD